MVQVNLPQNYGASPVICDHTVLPATRHRLTRPVLTPVRLRPVESHSGARGNILEGPPNIFTGPFWEENFFNFSFQNCRAYILVYFIFLADGGPPNVAGPGGS